MTFLSSLYEFTRDQGNMIAGILALAAGFAAYKAGQNQAKATREQSFQNLRIEKRKLAQESIKSSIIMKGIVKVAGAGINYEEPVKSSAAPLISILPYLRIMSGEFIVEYAKFFESLENFRTAGFDADARAAQCDCLSKTVNKLQQEADRVAERAYAVIAEQDADKARCL